MTKPRNCWNRAENDSDHALAKRTLELLKDPIRTNPALTPQHAVDVEKVNGLLRLAFGYYELGQYDEALKEFNSVLLIDPYNTAARRGMEQVNRARTSYFSSGAGRNPGGNALAEVSGPLGTPSFRYGSSRGAGILFPAPGKSRGERGPEAGHDPFAQGAAGAGYGGGSRGLPPQPVPGA